MCHLFTSPVLFVLGVYKPRVSLPHGRREFSRVPRSKVLNALCTLQCFCCRFSCPFLHLVPSCCARRMRLQQQTPRSTPMLYLSTCCIVPLPCCAPLGVAAEPAYYTSVETMGKLKKTAKKSRIDNMYVSHEKKTMMDDVKMCGDDEDAGKVSVAGLTKGELQKRQHNEWKSLRRSLEELAKEKRKLSSKDFDEKREKKVMRKHMIQLKEDMDEKHKNELEEFDRYVVAASPHAPDTSAHTAHLHTGKKKLHSARRSWRSPRSASRSFPRRSKKHSRTCMSKCCAHPPARTQHRVALTGSRTCCDALPFPPPFRYFFSVWFVPLRITSCPVTAASSPVTRISHQHPPPLPFPATPSSRCFEHAPTLD